MKTVSQFEANLLRLLQSILQRGPRERVLAILKAQAGRPACLSRAAVELIQDVLSKGAVTLLARTGWRRDRHLRLGQIRAGRLWERTSPQDLGLTFSRHALEFLLAVLDHAASVFSREKDKDPADSGPKSKGPRDRAPKEESAQPGVATLPWTAPVGELASGDRLLFFWVFEALRSTEMVEAPRGHVYFMQDGLCRLAFPDDFQEANAAPDWAPWTAGVGSYLLEALQMPLAEHWKSLELGKVKINVWQRMRSLGQSQERVLDGFAAALAAAGRWDLARFLLRALADLLTNNPGPQRWTGTLDLSKLRLADRQSVYQSALALVRFSEVLERWERQARSIGYFEEGYTAGQLWKADWETFRGEEMRRCAQGILREVEPLRT